jgi:hypothetical protein
MQTTIAIRDAAIGLASVLFLIDFKGHLQVAFLMVIKMIFRSITCMAF